MVYMDDEFLESNDLDWFSSYQDGTIAHFATGGNGTIPEKIRESIDNYEIIYDYFDSLESISEIEIIESNLPYFENEKSRFLYLRSFIKMAGKGIFSYDYRMGEGYKLISKPINRLSYNELPSSIKNILFIMPVNLSSELELIGLTS
ncbi:hypothetical protein NBG77_03680 [Proteus terrae]|uniref:hypothetical protein n=1 Tax=Proteus terrae TaxID=1574161 RepID=UPI0021BB1E5C|nr:hypothetical protein [Proteus terrae]MCT8262577.1 hypothetical protein [Proteus terrae]